MRDLTKAITSLYPAALWQLNGDDYSGLVWMSLDIQKPSEAELEAEDIRLQAVYKAKHYQRDRVKEYPPLADLADAMYWASQGDNTKLDNYYAACEAVKLKYPKS